MNSISSEVNFLPPHAAANSQVAAIGEVDIDQFLRLLITELQNQDPLNPLDNSEMLQQISQIREIGSNDRLSATLSAVLMGQNLATASSLIGKQIFALTDSAQNIQGVVDRVSVEVDQNDIGKRALKVHIGDQSVRLENVREIVGGTT